MCVIFVIYLLLGGRYWYSFKFNGMVFDDLSINGVCLGFWCWLYCILIELNRRISWVIIYCWWMVVLGLEWLSYERLFN